MEANKSPLAILAADPNLAAAFRNAIQKPLPHWSFDAMVRENERIRRQRTGEDHNDVGRGLTCDIADYQSGGRFASHGEIY